MIEHVERLRQAHQRAGERMKRKADEKLPSRLVQKGETQKKCSFLCVCGELRLKIDREVSSDRSSIHVGRALSAEENR